MQPDVRVYFPAISHFLMPSVCDIQAPNINILFFTSFRQDIATGPLPSPAITRCGEKYATNNYISPTQQTLAIQAPLGVIQK